MQTTKIYYLALVLFFLCFIVYLKYLLRISFEITFYNIKCTFSDYQSIPFSSHFHASPFYYKVEPVFLSVKQNIVIIFIKIVVSVFKLLGCFTRNRICFTSSEEVYHNLVTTDQRIAF